MPETIIRPYEEKMVNSALLEIPRNTYQRGLNPERVKRISQSRMKLSFLQTRPATVYRPALG